MNRWHFLAFSLVAFQPSCSTITNPEYLAEQASAKTSASPDAIVGTWQSKTVMDSVVEKSVTHKTLQLASGGGGTIRMSVRNPPAGPAQKQELPLSWNYDGSGRWQCQYGNGRGIIRFTGSRLLMESYYVLATESNGMPVTSVTHREVFDRPGSKRLDQSVKKGSPTKIDWIFTP